jgi:hypothetical protein
VSVARPPGSVLGVFDARGAARTVVVLGGTLILVGWFLPWGAAGAGNVSGLSDVFAPWFRLLVLVSGLLGVMTGTLVGYRAARWGIVVATVASVGWSLIFPAVVYAGARSLAGFGDAAATVGPAVGHGVGAYVLALGVVAIVLGCGPAVSAKRVVWVGTTLVAVFSGVLLVIGLG